MLLFAICLSASAQKLSSTNDWQSGMLKSQISMLEVQGMVVKKISEGRYVYYPEDKVPATSEDSLVTLTVQLDSAYDNTMYYPNLVRVYNQNYVKGDGKGPAMGQPSTFKLPRGTYDVSYSFNDSYFMKTFLVVKELVNISSDTTLIFNPADATCSIRFRSVSPTGEPWALPSFDADNNLIPGNCMSLYIASHLILGRVHGVSLGGSFCTSNMDYYANYSDNVTDFFVNPLSDRYTLTKSRMVIDNDYNLYASSSKLVGTDTDSICDGGDNYVACSEAIKVAPTNTDKWYAGHRSKEIIDNDDKGGGTNIGGWKPVTKDGPLTYYIDAPKDNSTEGAKDNFYLQMSKSNIYFAGLKEESDSSFQTYPTILPPIIFDQGVKTYDIIPETTYFNTSRIYVYTTDNEPITPLDGHPLFSFNESQKKDVFGDCVPLLRMEAACDTASIPQYYFSPKFFGRMGEEVQGCQLSMNINMKYDGEDMGVETYWDLSDINGLWDPIADPNGTFDLTIVTPYIDIDGNEAKNTTTMKFTRGEADNLAPTFSMLQFRDADNNVTARFEEAKDAKALFSAADYQFNQEDWTIGMSPAEVKVAYSPYGKQEWNDLTASQTDYAYINDGYAYETSLTDVKGTGWFDIKLTATDAAGNYQEQVISPAFGIGTTNNITGITGNDQSGRIIYNMQGMKASCTSAKGLYIIKDNGKVKKILAR